MTTPHAMQSTQRSAHVALRRLLEALVIAGAHPLLPRTVPPIARPSPRSQTATREELAALVAHAVPWERLLVVLAHDTALRARAAISLTRADFNPETGDITSRGKRGQVTRIPVSGRLRSLFQLCPPGDTPFVSLLAGQRVTYAMAQTHFRALCKRAGVTSPITLHDLRRTMAESAYQLSSDLRVVQTLLGHNSLHTTAQYLQRPASPATRAMLLDAMELTYAQTE